MTTKLRDLKQDLSNKGVALRSSMINRRMNLSGLTNEAGMIFKKILIILNLDPVLTAEKVEKAIVS